MGLLAQLFRHKSAAVPDSVPASPQVAPDGTRDVRGVGAIAAAAGVKTEHGMPSEFALPLGELLSRVPHHCVWPGRHDAARMLRIPSAEVAPGLARGKAEVSLARLVALAPEVFRWERSESDIPQVRLPIQKLLQQIRSEEAFPGASPFPHPAPAQRDTQPTPTLPDSATAVQDEGAPAIIAHQLDPIVFEKQEEPVSAPPAEAPAFSNPAMGSDLPSAEPSFIPELEIPEPPVQPQSGAPEARPTISVVATDAPDRPVELRPSKDASMSTTLRAVVLGGVASSAPANAQGQTGQILAPRIAPTASAVPAPVVLGPSVVPSAPDGGASRASRTTPDFAGLQNLFMTAAALDLSGVAALAAELPGVRACVISGSAGSTSAGDFLQGVTSEEVRAASADLACIGGAATETQPRGGSDIVLFLHDGICVAVVIPAGGFVPGVRERLARVAELLAGAPPAR